MQTQNQRSKKAFLMAFSHLDLYWLGTEEECLSRGNRIISRTIQLAESNPEFRFLLEDLVFVDYFIKTHPEKKKDLTALIEKGQIEIGSKWAGIYQNIQLGEDLVRNILYGKKFASKVFNISPSTIHLGDLPGYTPQYPQILIKSDIPYAVITRGGPSDIPLYYWQSPDGSTVLTWHAVQGYGWAWARGLHESLRKVKKNKLEQEIRAVMKQTAGPVMVHWGVDLILPNQTLVENVKKWNKQMPIKLAFATPAEYFAQVKKTNKIPKLSGEIPSLWPYLEPANVHITPLDIPATNLLLIAEQLATIVRFWKGSEYPASAFEQSWKWLLQGMDHNYDGQGERIGNQRKKEYRQNAIFMGEQIIRNSLATIAEQVEIPGKKECVPIVVYNSLSWIRTGLVEAHVTFYGDPHAFYIQHYEQYTLRDNRGKDIPFQVIKTTGGVTKSVTIIFIAENVPSLGYKSYYFVPNEKGQDFPGSVKVVEGKEDRRMIPTLTLKTKFCQITIDKFTGRYEIFNKALNRKVVKNIGILAVEEKPNNFFFRDDTTGRIFENELEKCEVVENGPVRAKLRLTGKIQGSETVQEISVYATIPEVDIQTIIEWEGDKPFRFQQIFPICIEHPEISYGIPYGVNTLDNLIPHIGPKYEDEIPKDAWLKLREIQKWIDIHNQRFGVTLSTIPRLVEIDGAAIKVNLIRGTKTPFFGLLKNNQWEYQYIQPKGKYSFAFSLSSHQGSWQTAKSYRKGWELQFPLLSRSVYNPEDEKTLPAEKSFCELSADNVILTVLKKAESADVPIIRCFEIEGKQKPIQLMFFRNPKEIIETNLLEEPIGQLKSIKPFEIKTLKIIPVEKTTDKK